MSMSTSKPADKNQQQIYVKSKVSKNFVQAPYSIIDASNISPTARMLWIYLESNSSEYLPDRKTISEHLGMAPKTVTTAKNTLLKHNMIFLEEVETKYKKIKHHLYTQDPSVWVGVVFKNNRSNNAGVKITPAAGVKITPAAGVKITPAAGVKITPNNREANTEKRIDSRGTGGEVRLSDHLPPDKSVTTTTMNFSRGDYQEYCAKQPGTESVNDKVRQTPLPLVGFYRQINKVTGHADPREKNRLFQAELNRLGKADFNYVVVKMESEGIKIVWTDPDKETEIPCERLAEFSDFLLEERSGSSQFL